MKKYLIISGFGWSGSGLLIDVLTSTNCWEKFPVEFRLFKDKGGVVDLMNSAKDLSRPFNYSIDLENFEKLSKVLGRSNGMRFGMNYNKLTNGRFSTAVNLFIGNLKKNYFYSDAFVFQYQNSFLCDLRWKILRKLGIRNRFKRKYLPSPILEIKRELFLFFDNLFSNYEKRIILDQAVDPGDECTIMELSERFVMISVDRDPRDIYVDYVNSKDVLFNVDSFIELFKITRNGLTFVNANILRTRFEILINNMDEELDRICSFLDIHDDHIKNLLKKYDFSQSKANIGIYNNFHDQKAIKKIEIELSEYCFEP